jgi:2-dehydropantoate 2-reductase
VKAETVVLTLQNGLDNVETIASLIGPDRILVGSVHVALQIVAPGVILHSAGEGKIVFGEPSGPPTARARRIAAVFERAGIPHELSAEMPRVLWEKFLFIAGIGGMTALARSGIGRLLDDPEGRAILRASCAEVVAVAAAEGVPLGPEATDRALHLAEGFPPQWRSSMARDVAEGRRIEVDALSGAVVRRGRKHNIPTPIHQVILGCLSAYEAGVLARS